MVTAVVTEREVDAGELRQLELSLERERYARVQVEQSLIEQNKRLEKENTELRRLLSVIESQKIQKEQELRKACIAAEAASRAKTMFLSTMSHELRSPLNAIIGYSELLLDDAQDMGNEQMVADLNTIKKSGRHLLDLINDTLDISKIEAGKMELSPSQVDLDYFVSELEKTVLPLMQKNENNFSLHVASEIDSIYTDPIRLKQILMNIISNAAKFTESGEVVLSISSTAQEDGRYCLFRVSDTGIGMSKTELVKAFQEFEQVDGSFSRRYDGTGLGLAISLKLCRLMGGDIFAESKKGVGSTFTISLPVEMKVQQVE